MLTLMLTRISQNLETLARRITTDGQVISADKHIQIIIRIKEILVIHKILLEVKETEIKILEMLEIITKIFKIRTIFTQIIDKIIIIIIIPTITDSLT